MKLESSVIMDTFFFENFTFEKNMAREYGGAVFLKCDPDFNRF